MPDFYSHMSPQQQAIITGEPGQAQDAMHGARACVMSGDRTYIVANGQLYRIGPEPDKTGRAKFGLGFGGSEWRILWPDGTEQFTHNLWHWGETDLEDNCMLVQREFWDSATRWGGSADMEFCVTYRVGYPEVACVMGQREHFSITATRERARNKSFPRCLLVNTYGEVHIHAFIRINRGKLYRLTKLLINKIICTRCWHWANKHWEANDEYGGTIDWGCTEKGCDC